MPEVTEVVEAADGHEALAAVGRQAPDVVLMDLSMPRMNGLEAMPLILKIAPATRVVVLSMYNEEECAHRVIRAGAVGYLTKSALFEELQEALRAAGRGETYVSRRLRPAHDRDAEQRLTPRQREVLQLSVEGLTTREIAERLAIGVKTVESHRMHLMQRLDIHGVAGLVRYAIRTGPVQYSS